MKAKAMDWARKAKDSHLRPRDIHFSVDKKFWPKVKMASVATTLSTVNW